MKFLHVVTFGLFASLFAVPSCSSGSSIYYGGGGTQCPLGYDPIPADVSTVPGMNKIANNSFVFSKNTNGTYTFGGMDAFFNDQVNAMMIHVHFNVNADATQTALPTTVCSRNMAQFRSDPGQTMAFSDFIPLPRNVTTDATGAVQTFQVENIGYFYSSTAAQALTPLNCDLSNTTALPIDPKTCGPVPGKGSIASMFPIKNPGDTLTVWCADVVNIGDCADPNAVKQYQIRYTTTRTRARPPFDQTVIEVVTQINWTPKTP